MRLFAIAIALTTLIVRRRAVLRQLVSNAHHAHSMRTARVGISRANPTAIHTLHLAYGLLKIQAGLVDSARLSRTVALFLKQHVWMVMDKAAHGEVLKLGAFPALIQKRVNASSFLLKTTATRHSAFGQTTNVCDP